VCFHFGEKGDIDWTSSWQIVPKCTLDRLDRFVVIFSKCFIMFWLVVLTILKNMKVNGKDDIPYIMETKKVPSHQPVMSFDP
jgi:hypothetical protein